MAFNILHRISTLVRRRVSLIVTVLVTLGLGFGNVFSLTTWAQGPKSVSPLAADLDTKFAVDWMQTIYDRVKADTVDAPGASRVYAYAGVTLYEAVEPGIPGDVSLSTQLKAMPPLSLPDPQAV